MRTEEEIQPDDGYSTPVAQVRGPSGRRFPRSGWIALAMLVAAAGSFLAGTQVAGSLRAPVATPGATSSLALSYTSSSPTSTASLSSTPAVFPPASRSSFERAVTTARTAFLGSSPQIVSAEVVRYGDVSRSSHVSPDTWVWVFTARGTFSFASCGGLTASPYPCPSPAVTARVIVDFQTGAFIEADVPALP